jgi:hypothetical protein
MKPKNNRLIVFSIAMIIALVAGGSQTINAYAVCLTLP